jgi:hypothetical protein
LAKKGPEIPLTFIFAMASSSTKSAVRMGENAWAKTPKVNAEFFALTYGAMVNQLVRDYEDVAEVNRQLEVMGYNIGIRLIDEFLAKSGMAAPCQNHQQTADTIAKVAFKMFLGVAADVTSWNAERTSFSLVIYENPLAEFVELPPSLSELRYSNLLCGAVRGALEMINIKADCRFLRDTLRGDEVNEIQVDITEVMEDSMGDEYRDNS